MGSLEEVIIVTKRTSFADRSSKKASFRKAKRLVCITIVKMVDIVPKNIIVRKC